jgi:hypothetical protein
VETTAIRAAAVERLVPPFLLCSLFFVLPILGSDSCPVFSSLTVVFFPPKVPPINVAANPQQPMNRPPPLEKAVERTPETVEQMYAAVPATPIFSGDDDLSSTAAGLTAVIPRQAPPRTTAESPESPLGELSLSFSSPIRPELGRLHQSSARKQHPETPLSLSFSPRSRPEHLGGRLHQSSGRKRRKVGEDQSAQRQPKKRGREAFEVRDADVADDADVSGDEDSHDVSHSGDDSFVVGDSVVEYDTSQSQSQSQDRLSAGGTPQSPASFHHRGTLLSPTSGGGGGGPFRGRHFEKVIRHVEGLHFSDTDESDRETAETETAVSRAAVLITIDAHEARSPFATLLRDTSLGGAPSGEFAFVPVFAVASLARHPVPEVSVGLGGSIGILRCPVGSVGDLPARLDELCRRFAQPFLLLEGDATTDGMRARQAIASVASRHPELSVLYAESTVEAVRRCILLACSASQIPLGAIGAMFPSAVDADGAFDVVGLQRALSFSLQEATPSRRVVEFLCGIHAQLSVGMALSLLLTFESLDGLAKVTKARCDLLCVHLYPPSNHVRPPAHSFFFLSSSNQPQHRGLYRKSSGRRRDMGNVPRLKEDGGLHVRQQNARGLLYYNLQISNSALREILLGKTVHVLRICEVFLLVDGLEQTQCDHLVAGKE